MNNLSSVDKAPFKQRVLETTLVAVRDKKHRRRQNRITATISISSILIISLVLLIKPPTTDHSRQTTSIVNPSPNTETPSRLADNPNLEISMAMNGDIKTVMLSPSDLAKIIFDPNFKFTEKPDSYTWKSKSTLIYMSLPKTSSAITDINYEVPY